MTTEAPAEQKKLQRNQSLDGFRGLGCLIVMMGHTQWKGETILPGALVAMDLFFVLSGFLITGLLLSELKKTGTISLTTFWKRRAIRLLPAFYVYYGFVAIVFAISRFKPILGTDTRVSLLATAFYASNWAVARGYDLGVYFVTWSLSLEEQFYFLCPIVLFSLSKFLNKKGIFIALGAVLLAVNLHRYFLFHSTILSEGTILASKRVFYGLDTRSDSLIVGCLGALFYDHYGKKIRIGLSTACLAWIMFLGPVLCVRDIPFAYHREGDSPFFDLLSAGGFCFFAVIGLVIIFHLIQFPHSYFSRAFSNRILVKIGIMSYSVYLWHTTVFGGIDILLASFNQSLPLWILKTLIRFVLALAVGYASFRLVEYPLLSYLFKKREFAPITKEQPA